MILDLSDNIRLLYKFEFICREVAMSFQRGGGNRCSISEQRRALEGLYWRNSSLHTAPEYFFSYLHYWTGRQVVIINNIMLSVFKEFSSSSYERLFNVRIGVRDLKTKVYDLLYCTVIDFMTFTHVFFYGYSTLSYVGNWHIHFHHFGRKLNIGLGV